MPGRHAYGKRSLAGGNKMIHKIKIPEGSRIAFGARIFWLRMAANEVLRNGRTDYRLSYLMHLLFTGRIIQKRWS